jgi:hypothetical protein
VGPGTAGAINFLFFEVASFEAADGPIRAGRFSCCLMFAGGHTGQSIDA